MDEEPLYADSTYGLNLCDLCGDLFSVDDIFIAYNNNFYCHKCLKEFGKVCKKNYEITEKFKK